MIYWLGVLSLSWILNTYFVILQTAGRNYYEDDHDAFNVDYFLAIVYLYYNGIVANSSTRQLTRNSFLHIIYLHKKGLCFLTACYKVRRLLWHIFCLFNDLLTMHHPIIKINRYSMWDRDRFVKFYGSFLHIFNCEELLSKWAIKRQ